MFDVQPALFQQPHPPPQILVPRVVVHELEFLCSGTGQVEITSLIREFEPMQGLFLFSRDASSRPIQVRKIAYRPRACA
jgi:hypothetical protein